MERLLDLALDDPEQALARARPLLTSADPVTRSYACQATGIVLRDRGRSREALAVLRRGLRAAAESGSRDREADVRATYAGALAFGGRLERSLEEFDRSLADARGETAAKIAMRRAAVLAMAGRHDAAAPAMRRAAGALQRAANDAWEARARVWCGHIELRLGRLGTAERELLRAVAILERTGADVDRFAATSNLAEVALARGDVAGALVRFEEAVDGYRRVGAPRFEELAAYAGAHLAAGLAIDAVRLLDEFAGGLADLDAAECALARAGALLAADDADAAIDAAATARRMFQRQGRTWFERRARLLRVRAAARTRGGAGAGAEAALVAEELHAERAAEAPAALTLAGRLARGERRRELWVAAATYRNHPNPLVRAAAWLARALEREAAGDRGGTLRACRAGLDAIDEQRRRLGSSELRAQATTHGRELSEVAVRAASSDPRRLLAWAERTRATTLAQPAMTSDATTIPEALAALRDNGRQLAEARAEGAPTERLERDRLRLERAVRSESHTVSAVAADRERPVPVEEIVAGVGDGCLVEVVDVDGVLHVVVVHGGRVRRRVAGSAAEVAALLDPVAMLLRRTARGRPASTVEVGRRLQDAILGGAASLIPDGPVVLAPTTRLHGLPWAVLPVLTDRPFSVVPSAGQWLRARAVPRPAERRTLLVAGPGLATGGAEVPVLAREHPDAHLLAGKQATLAAVLDGMDGADLVHLAAHGHFRADSPLFSSLDLVDGPLTVHDIERIGRAPYRVVLSACESGVLAPVGAQELLGLSAALFSLGTAGLVCSVAEVNDEATADLMVGLHAGLARGLDPATALHDVRRTATDPVTSATASAFLALGV